MVVALVASVLAVSAASRPASAALQPKSLPPLVPIDTMAECPDGGIGIAIGTPEGGTDCRSAPKNGVLVRLLDRHTLDPIGDDIRVGPCPHGGTEPCDFYDPFQPGLTSNVLVIYSAPEPVRFADHEPTGERLFTLGISPLGSPDVPAFSALVVGGCRECSPNVVRGVALADGPGAAAGREGQLDGYLQRSSNGRYTFVDGDFVAFDTLVEDDEGNPALVVGGEVHQIEEAKGRHGMAVTVLDSATLALDEGPSFYAFDDDTPQDREAEMDALADKLEEASSTAANRAGVIVVQTVGRPVPRDAVWSNSDRDDDVVDRLAALGANPSVVRTLNRPDAAGLAIPTGYALVSLPGEGGSSPRTVEATRPAVGTKVHLRGVFGRGNDGRFEPQLAESGGGVDRELFELAYRPASQWPTPSNDPVVESIRDQLVDLGVPGFEDLRDLYWRTIGDPRWQGWPDLLDQVSNDTGLNHFEQVRAELAAEFAAVRQVRAVLVDANSVLQSVLRYIGTETLGTLQFLTDRIVDELPVVEAFPIDWVDIVSSVLSVGLAATGVGGAIAGVAGKELADGVIDIITAVGDVVANTFALAGDAVVVAEEGTAAFEQAVRTTAGQLGVTLARGFNAQIVSLTRLAENLVSDPVRLATAAAAFGRPPYTINDASAIADAQRSMLVVAEQTILNALLPVGFTAKTSPEAHIDYRLNGHAVFYSWVRVRASQEQYTECSTNPSVGNVTATTGFVPFGLEEMTPHVQAFQIRPKYIEGDPPATNPERPRISRPLFDLLFTSSEGDVTFGGLRFPGAGLDRQEVFTRLLPRNDGHTVPVCDSTSGQFTGTALEFVSGRRTLADGPTGSLQALYGSGQTTAVDGVFESGIEVRFTDSAGNPLREVPGFLPGATVELSFPTGSGPTATIDGSSVVTATTDEHGVARFPAPTANHVPGLYTIRASAVYQNNHRATTTLSLRNAAPTETTVTSSANPAAASHPVTFTAEVDSGQEPAPSGEVEFRVDGILLGTAPVDGGVATSPPALDLSVGEHRVEAFYRGSASLESSAGSLVQVTAEGRPAEVALTADRSPSIVDGDVTFTASIDGDDPDGTTPGPRSGSVTFVVQDGETLPGCAAVTVAWEADRGTASCTTSFGTEGTVNLVAAYTGDRGLAPASSPPLSHNTVVAATGVLPLESSTQGAAVVGEEVTYEVTVRSLTPGVTPDGFVDVLVNHDTRCEGIETIVDDTDQSLSHATCTTAHTETGSDIRVDARFTPANPRGMLASVSGPFHQAVEQARTATAIEVRPEPSIVGQEVTIDLTTEVEDPGHGTPTGLARVTDGAGNAVPGCDDLALSPAGPDVVTTSCTTRFDESGPQDLVGHYLGDDLFRASASSAWDHRTDQVGTEVVLSADPGRAVVGQQVVYTATVTADHAAPTSLDGDVAFYEGSSPLPGCSAVPVVASAYVVTATCEVAFDSAGAHITKAAYLGDVSHERSDSIYHVVPVDAAATTTALTVTPNPASWDTEVVLEAEVAPRAPGGGVPNGVVLFSHDEDVAVIGLLIEGRATVRMGDLGPGSHTFVARYVGDGDHLGSESASGALVVAPAPTELTTDAPRPSGFLNLQRVLRAHLHRVDDGRPVAGQPITFWIGSSAVCRNVLTNDQGAATCVVSALRMLTQQTYRASFPGTPTYEASPSAPLR